MLAPYLRGMERVLGKEPNVLVGVAANDNELSSETQEGIARQDDPWMPLSRRTDRILRALERMGSTKPVLPGEGDVEGHEEAMRDRSDRHSGKAGRRSRAPLAAWRDGRGEVWA